MNANGLTMRAWMERAIKAYTNRDDMLAVLEAWPHTPEATQTLRDLYDGGVLNDLEYLGITSERLARGQTGWHPGYTGEKREVRVINGLVRNIHMPYQCQGRHCWIHNPSEHDLLGWPTHYWDATTEAVRVCQHWDMHPDPDDLAFRTALDLEIGPHECECRCCQ